MSKNEKIFKICLITFLTLIAVGGMIGFALSAQTSAGLPKNQYPLTSESIMETHKEAVRTVLTALNEIDHYFDYLENMENRDEALKPAGSLPTLESGVKFDFRKNNTFGADGNIPSTVIRDLTPYIGWILWIEPAISGDSENLEIESINNSEHTVPEAIEMSNNQE